MINLLFHRATRHRTGTYKVYKIKLDFSFFKNTTAVADYIKMQVIHLPTRCYQHWDVMWLLMTIEGMVTLMVPLQNKVCWLMDLWVVLISDNYGGTAIIEIFYALKKEDFAI
jgi:hypothetical protein